MYCDFACFTAIVHFVANFVRGSSRFITVLHTGRGGQSNLLQYYIVLRNI